MGPVLGMALGVVAGSVRLFGRSLAGLLVGSLLVFGVGAASGYLASLSVPVNLGQAYLHAQLAWPNLLVLLVIAVVGTAALAGAHSRPSLMAAARVASVGLAYEILTPLVAAGYGLGSGAPHLFPDALLVLAVHLSWTVLFGSLTLAVLGCRPLTWFGYTFGGAVSLGAIIAVVGLGSIGTVFGAQVALPTAIPTATFTPTPVPPTSTLTLTPVPPTATTTPAPTQTQTATLPPSPTPSPTPVYALVQSEDGNGGRMRATPGFTGRTIQIYLNNTLMIVLPETETVDGYIWIKVRAPDGNEGWMLSTLLVGATPAPNWTP
jgi:hypothetical protein